MPLALSLSLFLYEVILRRAEEDLRRWNEEWRGKLNQLLLEGVAERLEEFNFLKEELKSLEAEKKKREDQVEYFLKKLVEFDEEKENLQAIQYTRRHLRVFNTTGAVNENFHYVVPLQDLRGASIMERIANGTYLLLHGARQTGKSSHLEYVRSVALRGWLPDINSQVIKRHCSKGLIVIQLNFELVDFSSLDSFWDSIFSIFAKYNPKHFDIDIEALQKLSPSAKKQAFQNLFLLEKFPKLVLLLVDEFDMILKQITIKFEFLSALLVAAGTYNITTLLESTSNQDSSFGKNDILPHIIYQSPFNVKEVMWCMDLDTLNSIATDIYERTHGHPGLTSQCGQILKDEVLSRKSNSQLVTAARKLLTTYLYHTFLAEPTLDVLPAANYLIAIEIFSPDNGSVKILILLQHAVKLLQPQTLLAQEVLNLEKTRILGDAWNDLFVLLEAKDPLNMGQRRLDLLIRNSKKFVIELKVDSTSENEVNDSISQLEDYADAIDADESYLIIYTKNLPNIYKQIVTLTQSTIIWLVNKKGHRKLDFVIANQEIIKIDLQKHF
ncbi:16553_t:CDS:2 [Funneliformis caledonium]|uniref:16553_t:CDS:1 n=1 Tax=Funneliformis caledonium TaxID=1117310 RepID=A0A9N9EEJ8_9GLOM|nr:16553_t:CDS:2 [Funneliformis caledonium]